MTLSVRMIVLTRRPSLACPVAIMHFSTEFERGIRFGAGQSEAETSRGMQNSTIDLEIDVCTQSSSLLKVENSTRSACPRETRVRKKRLVPIVDQLCLSCHICPRPQVSRRRSERKQRAALGRERAIYPKSTILENRDSTSNRKSRLTPVHVLMRRQQKTGKVTLGSTDTLHALKCRQAKQREGENRKLEDSS